MRKMVLEVPANEFYRANFGFLHPVMVMVWGQWASANAMETHPIRGDREKAFMLAKYYVSTRGVELARETR